MKFAKKLVSFVAATIVSVSSLSLAVNAYDSYSWSLRFTPGAPTGDNHIVDTKDAKCSSTGRMLVQCTKIEDNTTIAFNFYTETYNGSTTERSYISVVNGNTISKKTTKTMNGNFYGNFWYKCEASFTENYYSSTRSPKGVYK